MKIQHDNHEDRLVILLLGSLSSSGDAQLFADYARQTITADTTSVCIDFNQAAIPDSRFIGRVIELYHYCKGRGIEVRLRADRNRDVAELIRFTELDEFMPLES
jgi:anti-anti-sigma regulatory factor